MTKLQKALKEKAVLEKALRITCVHITGIVGKCDRCEIDFYKVCQYDGRTCDEMLAAHFKAKAEKGGR